MAADTLERAIEKLSRRERIVIVLYFGPMKASLWDLAAMFEVSDSMISLIKTKALKKLRGTLQRAAFRDGDRPW